MDTEPIAREIQANDRSMRHGAHAFFLLVRGSERPQATARDDEKRRCGMLDNLAVPQGADAIAALANAGDGGKIA